MLSNIGETGLCRMAQGRPKWRLICDDYLFGDTGELVDSAGWLCASAGLYRTAKMIRTTKKREKTRSRTRSENLIEAT